MRYTISPSSPPLAVHPPGLVAPEPCMLFLLAAFQTGSLPSLHTNLGGWMLRRCSCCCLPPPPLLHSHRLDTNNAPAQDHRLDTYNAPALNHRAQPPHSSRGSISHAMFSAVTLTYGHSFSVSSLTQFSS